MQPGKACAIEAPIAAEQRVGLAKRVRSNQKVGDDPRLTGRTAAPELLPELSGQRRRVGLEGIESNRQHADGFPERILIREVRPHLRPDDVARDERARPVGTTERLA